MSEFFRQRVREHVIWALLTSVAILSLIGVGAVFEGVVPTLLAATVLMLVVALWTLIETPAFIDEEQRKEIKRLEQSIDSENSTPRQEVIHFRCLVGAAGYSPGDIFGVPPSEAKSYLKSDGFEKVTLERTMNYLDGTVDELYSLVQEFKDHPPDAGHYYPDLPDQRQSLMEVLERFRLEIAIARNLKALGEWVDTYDSLDGLRTALLNEARGAGDIQRYETLVSRLRTFLTDRLRQRQ